MLVLMVTASILAVGGMMYAVGNTLGYEKCEKDREQQEKFWEDVKKNGL